MILYSAPSSYYSTIARLALLESNIAFEIRSMDIHFKKEQLTPWYLAINPKMTVPSLAEDEKLWTDSRSILELAATTAGNKWCDTEVDCASSIKKIVTSHYAISIEQLTFGKAMTKISPLQLLFPHILRTIIRHLEASLKSSANPTAIESKILLNQQRIAYFTEGNLKDKLEIQREIIRKYLAELPSPGPLLFGDRPSSADIVTTILFARLKMIGEYDLVKPYPSLLGWFERMQARPNFKKADVWMRFHPLRMFLSDIL